MDPRLVDDLETRPSVPRDRGVSGAEALEWSALRCPCGSDAFRLTGWPRITTGRGSLFWRSVTRVFRETRQPMEEGELREAPFWLPVWAACEACDRRSMLLDAACVVDRLAEEGRDEPLESYRCRVCRLSRVQLVVGEGIDADAPDRVDHVVVARCAACERESRVAWSRGRPSEQEVTLDLLYGRR